MKRLKFIIFILVSFNLSGQTGQLRLNIQLSDNDSCHSVLVLIGQDTVVYEAFSNYMDFTLDSLETGIYQVLLYCERDILDPVVRRTTYVYDDKINTCTIDYSTFDNLNTYDKITKEETIHQSFEGCLTFSYFDDRYLNSKSIFNEYFGIGLRAYYWKPTFKHMGFLGGGGFTYSEYNISSDTTFAPSSSSSKIKERYKSFNINAEVKVRFTLGNQKVWHHYGKTNAIIDLGIGYNFPLIFRSSTNYAGNLKLVKRNLHEFSDFRAFVNVGYAPILFFMEYRIVDFIKQGYPEIPIYNFGIRISIRG